MAGGSALEERRDRMVAACEAVDGLGDELWRAGSAELEQVMAQADQMVAAGEAARVAVLAEVISRGGTGSGPEALSPVQWVRRHAPGTRAGGAAQIVAVAQAFAVPRRSAVKDAVLSGVLCRGGALRGRQAAAVHCRAGSPDRTRGADPDRR